MWTARIGGGTRIDIRGQLAGWFLGATGGMGINLLSNDIFGNQVGYRGVAAVFAVGSVISGTNWLLRLPYRAALSDHTPPILLGLALAAVVVTLVDSRARTGTAILAAVVLIAATVFILIDIATAGRFLFGTGFIGFGVVAIGAGVAMLHENDLLVGAAVAGGAVAVIGIGVAMLRESNRLVGAGDIGVGAALIALGVAALRESNLSLGVAFIGFGVAFICAGTARLFESKIMFGAAAIGVGTGAIGVGGAVLLTGDLLFGAAVIGLGVGAVGIGVAILFENDLLLGIGLIVAGVATTGIGVARLRKNDLMFGAAAIGTGATIIGIGVAFIRIRGRKTRSSLAGSVPGPGLSESLEGGQ
ncbi:MAG TPA: hypothetical protein VHJ83_17305 [Micromonosporaceae bacterium]|nr:hypothetical protein [Micromonosporaceae bacterium]